LLNVFIGLRESSNEISHQYSDVTEN
jgi:hypothetical protein